MEKSITLLNRALERTKAIDLAAHIGVHHSALSNSKKMGQLSPLLAGNIAIFLNENVEHWMAIAAAESCREGRAKELLMEHLKGTVKSCF